MFNDIRSIRNLPACQWSVGPLPGFAGNIHKLPIMLWRPPKNDHVPARADTGQVFDGIWTVGCLPTGQSSANRLSSDCSYITKVPIATLRGNQHNYVPSRVSKANK